jgi:hypothetical protein
MNIIPNNLSALLPTFFFAAQVIQREATHLISSVYVNAELAQIAKGMTATYPVAPPAKGYDIIPGNIPVINGETAGSGTITISKSRAFSFEYTGEEQRQLSIAGIYSNQYMNQILERMRSIRNEIETDLAALYVGASRAVGTAGTTPFAVNLAASPTVTGMEGFANMTKEMTDLGCPPVGRSAAFNSTAAAKVRNIPNLFRANEAGSDHQLRTGELGTIENFLCGESGQIKPVSTLGNGTNYVVNGATAAGSTSIVLKTGSGTVLAGDIVSFASSTGRQYIVSTGIAAPGTITIARPGLADNLPDGDVMTLNATAFTPNLFMTKDAIHLVERQPLLPGLGGSASGNGGAGGILLDTAIIPDPGTGLYYQVAMWSMYRQVMIEIAANWGAAVANPQDLLVLLG